MENMNISANVEFAIPVAQIIFYMFVSTLCFLIRKYKLGLMISFTFVFYWGFLHSSSSFVDMVGNLTLGYYLYLFSGFLIITLALMGFFQEKDFPRSSYRYLPSNQIPAHSCINSDNEDNISESQDEEEKQLCS